MFRMHIELERSRDMSLGYRDRQPSPQMDRLVDTEPQHWLSFYFWPYSGGGLEIPYRDIRKYKFISQERIR